MPGEAARGAFGSAPPSHPSFRSLSSAFAAPPPRACAAAQPLPVPPACHGPPSLLHSHPWGLPNRETKSWSPVLLSKDEEDPACREHSVRTVTTERGTGAQGPCRQTNRAARLPAESAVSWHSEKRTDRHTARDLQKLGRARPPTWRAAASRRRKAWHGERLRRPDRPLGTTSHACLVVRLLFILLQPR